MEVAENGSTVLKEVAGENEPAANPGEGPQAGRTRESVQTIELIVRKPHWEDFWRGVRSVVVVLEATCFGLALVFVIAVCWFR
ncbi:MAG: hypothetical protein OXP66_00510 [Candidatus Tectomicrobia bacterium]|nr:hypothetical protein [Candidatus Tectomicrobia bacterium]